MLRACHCLHSSVCPHALAALGFYVHLVPGRLRLDVPARSAARLESSLGQLEGVRRVRCSSRSGRALIEYDPQAVAVERILEAIFADEEGSAPGFGAKSSLVANSLLGKAAGFVLESLLKAALG